MDTRSSRTKVETKKVKKKRLNVSRLLVFMLLIYLIVCLVMYLLKVPVKHYEITGNSIVSDADILRDLKLDNYPSIFSLKLNKLENIAKKNVYIKDCEISYGWNFTIKIKITENKPILYTHFDNSLLLSDGSVTEGENTNFNLPVLLNTTPDKILKTLVNKLSLVDDGVLSMISEIEYQPSYSSDGNVIDDARFLIYMSDENLVYVTAKKANLLNNYLSVIATSLIGGAGTLYLDGNEERYTFVLFDEKNIIKREKIDLGVVSDDGART